MVGREKFCLLSSIRIYVVYFGMCLILSLIKYFIILVFTSKVELELESLVIKREQGILKMPA